MAEHRTINEVNGVDVDVVQATVESLRQDPELAQCRFHITNGWIGGCHNRSIIDTWYGAKRENEHEHMFELESDEPPILAGHDQAPNPVEHLLNALAACITTSMVEHAAARGIHVRRLESEIEGDIDLRGFLGIDPQVPKGYTDIRVKFKVDTDETDVEKLRALAEYSPVYNTLIHGVNVDIQIERK